MLAPHRYTCFAFLAIFTVLIWHPTLAQKPDEPLGRAQDSIPISTLELPVKLSLAILEEKINQETKEIIYANDHLEVANGMEFSLKIRKLDTIRLLTRDQALYSKAPLKVRIKGNFKAKVMGLTLSKEVNEEIKVLTLFRTQLTLDSNWQVIPKTELVSHEWLETPTVSLGIMRISVTSVLDDVIADQAKYITQQVDEQLKPQLDLNLAVKQAWNLFQLPYAVSNWGKQRTWLSFQPQNLTLTKIYFENNEIKTDLAIQAHTKARFAIQADSFGLKKLPRPHFGENIGEKVQLHIAGSTAKETALEKAREIFQGEEYSFRNGKHKLKVNDIDLYPKGNRIVIQLSTQGSIEGQLYLIGKPAYNPKTQKLEIDQFEYEVDGQVKISKFTRWLFGKRIKREIKESTEEILNEQIQSLRQEIEKNLEDFPLNQNAHLKGEVQAFYFKDISLKEDTIFAHVILNGLFQIDITAL